MARNKFGGTNMDVVWAPVGRLAAFAPPHTLTMYDAEEGGNRLDDLLDKDGNPVTSIRSRADGGVPLFWGPDGVTEMWVDDGDDKRALMVTQGRAGASAYQIALDNGFEGTEEEWVASLLPDVKVDFDAQRLVLPGVTGSYVDTPDAAALRVTGDLDVRFYALAPDDWTPAGNTNLAGKQATTGNQRSWTVQLVPAGAVRLTVCLDGITATNVVHAGTVPGAVDGQPLDLRITREAATGVVRWFTRIDGTWTQYATGTAVTGNLFASTAALEVGATNSGTAPMTGSLAKFELRNGIDGTLVAAVDFTDEDAWTGRTGVDPQGNPWTLRGTTTLTEPALTIERGADAYRIDRSSDVQKRIAGSIAAALAPPPPMRVVETLQTGHGWTDTGSVGGTATLNDTTNFLFGTQAATRVSNGAGGTNRLRGPQRTAVNFTGCFAEVLMQVTGVRDHSGGMSIIAFAGSTATHFRWDVLNQPTNTKFWFADDRWAGLTLNFEDAAQVTPDGSPPPSRANITGWQVLYNDRNGGTPVRLTVQRVRRVAQPSDAVVTLGWDDGFTSQLTAARLLGKYGFRGVFFPILDRIGVTNYMSLAEFRSIQDDMGHLIGSHALLDTTHGARYTSLSSTDLDAEYDGMRTGAIANGFEGWQHLAYPGGEYKTREYDRLRDHGFLTARGTFNVLPTDTFPWADRYQIRAVGLSSGITLASARDLVDRCIAANGRLHIYGHRLGAVADGNTWTVADYDALLAHIAERGVRVETPDQQHAQQVATPA